MVLPVLEAPLGAFGEDAVPQHHLVQVLTHPPLRIHLRPPPAAPHWVCRTPNQRCETTAVKLPWEVTAGQVPVAAMASRL